MPDTTPCDFCSRPSCNVGLRDTRSRAIYRVCKPHLRTYETFVGFEPVGGDRSYPRDESRTLLDKLLGRD